MKLKNFNQRVIALVLTIVALAVGQGSAWAQYPASIGSIQYNSTLEAYEINSVANLNDLAVYVNGTGTYSTSLDETTAHSCEGMTFKVTADITIPYTTEWDDATSTENNYTPIGGVFINSTRSFRGTFDGQGHTVSGIRIYRSGNGNDDRDLGLFGAVYGTVKNVTVSDMRVTGYSYVGGIAGYNTSGGKIVNCHATATVALHALQNNANCFGGIVGFHYQGFISGCSSAVTLTVTGEPTQCMAFGGIVGVCDGDMHNCLAVGVRLPAIHYSDDYNEEDASGAIAGDMCQNHAITDNYYSGCYLDGTLTENGIGVGDDLDTKTRHDLTSFKYKSITYTNCAVPATTLHTLTVGTGLTAAGSVCPQTNGSAYSIIPGTEVTLGYNGALDTYQLATYSLGDTPLTGNTFTMPDADATAAVNVVNIWNTDHEADGSAEKPFIISTTQELDELARRVNNGTGDPDAATGYSSKYFELGDDITYSTVGLGETESNYTPIGNDNIRFYGNFDGKNKTVSGIRIYRGGNDLNDDCNLGLFGIIDGSIVQNVTVSDACITGYMYVGGIVGYNFCGTVKNCHATSTVVLHAVQDYASCFGGIAGGNNRSTIDGCTSAATIGKVGDISDFEACGGIVGQNNGISSRKGVIQNCLALGVNVTADGYVGAIVGSNSTNTSLGQNYYNGCTIGTATTGIGCNGVDITDNDGARAVFTITPASGISVSGATVTYNNVPYFAKNAQVTLSYSGEMTQGYNAIMYVVTPLDGSTDLSGYGLVDGYTFLMPAVDLLASVNENDLALFLLDNDYTRPDGKKNTDYIAIGGSRNKVFLQDRTLYKDGYWNTLCLPFSLDAMELAASRLAGATLMELDVTGTYDTDKQTGFDATTGTLYLFFKNATSITAGRPYVIKWGTPDSHPNSDLVNPVFTGVNIDNSAEAIARKTVTSADGKVSFTGNYSHVSFEANDRSILFLGSANKLYYPTANMNIKSCRAYFQLNNGLTVDIVSNARMNVDDENEVNGVNEVIASLGVNDDSWYTLDGRKLSGKPTAKGLYINKGKKIVINK